MWEKIRALLTNEWMNDAGYLAAMAHIGWAAFLMLAGYIFAPEHVVYVGGAIVIFAALKEYVYDANFELPTQTFRDNTEDFLGYVGGMLLGGLIILMHRGLQ